MRSTRLCLGDATGFHTFATQHTSREGGRGVGVCVCVCVAGGKQLLASSPPPPEGSAQLPIVRLVSEAVWHCGRQVIGWIALYDVCYDSFTLRWEGVALLAGVPSAPSHTHIFYLCWLLVVHIFDSSIYSHLAAPSLIPAAQESGAKETLMDVFFHPPSPRTVPIMTRSLWHSTVSWHKPPAAIARAGRHQGGCWDTLQRFTYSVWLCQTHTLAVVFSHAHTSWISCFEEQRRVQASWVCTRCTRQKEGKGRKRQRVCVIPPTAEKNTPMSKSTLLPPAQRSDYCQVDNKTRAVRASPRGLIRFEAHPGTLSFAFECTHFLTLIPHKPLQLM